ncbi:MAG TPA: ATP-binding protein [Ktedonobacterales bacterium]
MWFWILLSLALAGLTILLFFRQREEWGMRQVAEANARRMGRELDLAHKDLERMRTLFGSALNAFPRPVLVTDTSRVVLTANPAALKLLDLPREQVEGRLIARLLQHYDATNMLIDAMKTGEPRERVIQRDTTGELWHIGATPLRLGGALPGTSRADPDGTYLVVTIEDLTEIRRLETVRRDFVAHVSHELRTPLASVRLLAETARDAVERDPAAARGFADRIIGEVDHLRQMVSELLALAQAESGSASLQLEPTDMSGLVEVVMERMRPIATERGVTLLADLPEDVPDAQVDSRRMVQVLTNLVDNALKFTEEGGTVRVTTHVNAHDGAKPLLAISVSDTGIGIPQDELPRVFERFYKVDRSRARSASGPHAASQASGTGLGLAIAKHLVELHGGRIWAESRPGQGSTFTFTVPIASASASSGVSADGARVAS